MAGATEAFYLNVLTDQGPPGRFCLYHPPQGRDLAGLVVYVHPFAEEMNKSRRMAAIQSRALAAAGWATLQIDLLGCGDSEGDFCDASWSQWVADVVAASRWLLARHAGAHPPLWLWGHRAGALIAVQAADQLDIAVNFVLWQPAVNGRALLQQFLRLKTVADLKSELRPGAALLALRQQFAAGEAVEVAGYALTAPLAVGLQEAQLTPPVRAGRAVWLELSQRPEGTLSPAALTAIEAWRCAGHGVYAQALQGPAFWQTVEVEDAPALVSATLSALESMRWRPSIDEAPSLAAEGGV
jgi:exosortase A-associated hydrolase 2